MKSPSRSKVQATLLLSAALFMAVSAGCKSPSAANIALRKENQQLQTKIDNLQRRHDADQATIKSLETRATTVPVLPQERIEKLFTTHGIQLGRLTGGADLDPSKPGDDCLKVYLTPTDDAGQPLKAAGAIVVEAFDLAQGDNVRIGRWEFDLGQSRAAWNGQALLYAYVLTCPWQTLPIHPELTLKITFTDELSGRSFTAQKAVKIVPPANAAIAK